MRALHTDGGAASIGAMGGCPDENVLVQLAHGGLAAGDDLARLEAHLDGCASCRRLVAAVAGGSAPAAPLEKLVLQPGDRMGRYEIERFIGAGGMGLLYVAHDTQLHRRVALKLMRPLFADEAGKARLLREAQAMARLSHPNVVNVYDLGEVEGRLFVAMELIEGGTLRDWLRTPRPWREVLDVFRAAGEGLAAAHRAGVVHRDFKPENVLVGPDKRPRVGDFGLARPDDAPAAVAVLATGAVEITQAGAMLGTPAYMSPEQLMRRPADARSDQYSFCVALYEALYGRRPFEGSTVEEMRARVHGGVLRKPVVRDLALPDAVWNALARGLSVSAGQRFPTMEALLAALRRTERHAMQWAGAAVLVVAVLAALVVIGRSGASLSPTPIPVPVPVAAPARAASGLPPAPAAVVDPAPRDEAVTVEADAEPLPANGVEISLVPGSARLFAAPGVTRIAIGEPKVADVTPRPATFELRGVAPGQTRLTVSSDKGERNFPVAVRPVVSVARSVLVLERGTQRVFTVPALDRVAVGNPDVVDVKPLGHGELLVIGRTVGSTNVLTWAKDATRHEYEIRVTEPRSPAGDESLLRIRLGFQKVLTFPGMSRIAVGDPSIADVKAIGNDQLLVLGVGRGKTTLLVWKNGGERTSLLLWVDAEDASSSTVQVPVGATRAIAVPGLTRVAVGDPEIADVKVNGNTVLVTGKGAGKTTVLAWGANGARTPYLISVPEPPARVVPKAETGSPSP